VIVRNREHPRRDAADQHAASTSPSTEPSAAATRLPRAYVSSPSRGSNRGSNAPAAVADGRRTNADLPGETANTGECPWPPENPRSGRSGIPPVGRLKREHAGRSHQLIPAGSYRGSNEMARLKLRAIRRPRAATGTRCDRSRSQGVLRSGLQVRSGNARCADRYVGRRDSRRPSVRRSVRAHQGNRRGRSAALAFRWVCGC
jgi:hypothetical protein